METRNHIHKGPYWPPRTDKENSEDKTRSRAANLAEQENRPEDAESAQEMGDQESKRQLTRSAPGQNQEGSVEMVPRDGSQNQPLAQPQHRSGREGAPAVRLDMDLDVDVELKAKIQGDITLAILEGDQNGGPVH